MSIPLHRNTLAARERLAAGSPRCRCNEAPSSPLLHAIDQFNRRELFECHETLEELWLAETDELRYLYQGILQVGVGYLHLQRGNHHGAVTKLHSGCALLEYFVPNCLGIEVQALMDAANRDLKRLQSLGVERLEEFDLATIPTIGMTPRVGEAA